MVLIHLLLHHYQYRPKLNKLIQQALELEKGLGDRLSPESAKREFNMAMENDLDTPKATEVMMELAGSILASWKGGMKVGQAQKAIREMFGIFGLRFGGGLEDRVVKAWGEYLKNFDR